MNCPPEDSQTRWPDHWLRPSAGWINRQQQDVWSKITEPEFGSVGEGEVGCRERLGGLLRDYYRDAA